LPELEKEDVMNTRWSHFIGPVILLGLYLRLNYLLHMPHEPLVWDQLEYTKLALQLLERGFYAYRDTVPNSLVTPGFPLFLAGVLKLFGYEPLEKGLTALRILQAFIGAGTLWFIYRMGCRLFQPAVGLLAALFAAVYPSYVWSASLVLTEVLFLAFFTAMLYVQVLILQENRLRHHVLMGLLLGLTVLIRPNVLPIGAVPYLLLWLRNRTIPWRMALPAAAAFCAAMSPWWLRNALTFHEFIFIAKGEAGNPFLGGTDPYFRGTIDWSRIDEKHQFAEGMRRLREGLRTDPWLWLRWMTVGKFAVFIKTLWVGPYADAVAPVYYQLLRKLHFFLVYAGFPLLAVFCWRNRSLLYLALCLGLFLGVHLMFIPVDRYLYGMLPFLMLGTACGTVSAAEWLARLAGRMRMQNKKA
jgi:4-amino-4-deoxy-L-arabinose transferase-like glycosyltransferase